MAISEAMGRWASHSTANSDDPAEFGFDVDPSSNGMAAFPDVPQRQRDVPLLLRVAWLDIRRRCVRALAVRIRASVVLCFLLAAPGACKGAGQHVFVAAAANLGVVLAPLDAEFLKAHAGVAISEEIGASGSLVSQIESGAPYDVFLSADLQYPRKLIEAGGARGSSLVVFAIGKLVLWSTRPGLDLLSVGSVVRNPAVVRLAVANPSTAPYGRAAVEALAKLGLSEEARPKLVYGENVNQTAQFVLTGNAEAGFVALSQVLSPKLKGTGRWVEVPPTAYSPIQQGGVLTLRGVDNPAAREYLEFLATPPARAVFARFGYDLP
jgi:molybdate transport system substrate-binding protein